MEHEEPRAENDKIRRQIDHFDSIADQYLRARQLPNHLLLKKLMWRYFFEHTPLELRSGMNVLEPMCGYADGRRILEEHYGQHIRYSGFDYSGRVIETLRKTCPHLNIWQADVTTFVPDSERFDLIIVLGGLHHVPDHAKRVIANLTKGLKQGGYFLSLEPTNGNPLVRAVRQQIYRKNKLFDEKSERAFGVGELARMFIEAGLEPVELQYPGLLSYILYYNPDAFPFLNIGWSAMVRATFALDRLIIRSQIGRVLSFAMLSLWRKPG